ncbi:MAG: thiamine phosphate synthase [Vicingaceae bacterium]
MEPLFNKNIEKLQYITQATNSLSYIDCVREACVEGAKWVQLRIKNKTEEEVLNIAKEARIITRLFDAKLIINDFVEIAQKVEADGVHLGKTDMLPEQAREILGGDLIIGATANTIVDIEFLLQQPIDYIGLGPFKHTNTKENLSPVLGLNGYKEILSKLSPQQLQTPIIAIGGIIMEDIEPLLFTGVYGIAVSKAITDNFKLIPEFMEIIENIKIC